MSQMPDKIWLHKDTKHSTADTVCGYQYKFLTEEEGADNFVEYTRTDAFIEKVRKWFEKQNEWFDPNGNRHCDLNDFKDFKNYMKRE